MNVTRTEAMRYIYAEKQLEYLKDDYECRVQAAYENIHPTRTVPCYETGELYIESMCPMNFAIYLCELKENYEKVKKEHEQRIEVLQRVKKKLSKHERKNIYSFNSIGKVQEILSEMFPNNKKDNVLKELMEYDQQIDNMSDAELLNDYVDCIG